MLAGAGAQFFDNNGIPLAGGLVYTYTAGTTTLQAAYTTSAGSIAHANPIVLDSTGRVPSGGEIWLTEGVSYKFVLKTSGASTIGTYDNVTGNASGVASGIYATFAASSGSSLVGYIQGSASSVATTVQAKLRQTVSVKDFGAVGDGTTNDTTAIQAAINAMNSIGGGQVYFPSGTYKTGALTMYANIAIQGAGIGQTIIAPNSAGIVIFSLIKTVSSYVNVSFSNFQINCGSTATVDGIYLTLCQTTAIQNVGFYGCVNNFILDRGRFHTITDCLSSGTSTLRAGRIKIWSSSDTDYIGQVNLQNYIVENIGNGTQDNNIYIRRCIASLFSKINCNDVTTGAGSVFILLENDCQGCKFTDCIFAKANYGVVVATGSGVAVPPSFCTFTSVDIDQAVSNAYWFQQSNYCQIIGGNVTASGVSTSISAILFGSGDQFITIVGQAVNGYSGINGIGYQLNGSAYITLIGNQIINCTSGIGFGATPTYITAIGNYFASCTNPFTGSPGQTGNYIVNNDGLSLTSISPTPAVPATTVAVTNNYGAPATVFIVGGTGTAVVISGKTCPYLSTGYRVLPNQTISITYSSAPTWTWILE